MKGQLRRSGHVRRSGRASQSDSPADLHGCANLQPAPERVSTSQKLCTIRESTEGVQPSHEEDIGICRRVSARVHFRSPLPPFGWLKQIGPLYFTSPSLLAVIL